MAFLSVLLVALTFLNPLEIPHVQCINTGFTTDLIRLDSQEVSTDASSSPSSHFERLSNAFDRSFSRAAYLKHARSKALSSLFESSFASSPIESSIAPSASSFDSPVTGIGGEYLMQVSIGTPPLVINAIADTGSDVAWTQCKPCTDCFKQNDPLFDPKKTSSYRRLSCESSKCQALGTSSCDRANRCIYQLAYGDRSTSVGDLAVDTFTFSSSNGKKVSFPKITFGCGHENSGTFNETTSGIIGLGGGPLSIVNQFSSTIQRRFSYCLVPIDKSVSSKISFGIDSSTLGSGAVSTPLIKQTPDTFYFLSLEAISVGNSRDDSEKISPKKQLPGSPEGNIIIDSGTTLTFIPAQLYDGLQTRLEKVIKAEPSPDPSGTFGLCYNIADRGLNFPSIVFHFEDADVVLPPENTFLQVSEGLVCLTIVPSEDISILGNLSQMNFLIEYDLENSKLSFLPTDCTKVK